MSKNIDQGEQHSGRPTRCTTLKVATPAGCRKQQCRREGCANNTAQVTHQEPEAERSCADLTNDQGAVTAEYAIVIMAAVAFAGLLVAIMSSGEVRGLLVDLVQKALASAG